MNPKLKADLEKIRSIGEKILMLEESIEEKYEQMKTLQHVGQGITGLPEVTETIHKAVAAMQQELESESEELKNLRAELHK